MNTAIDIAIAGVLALIVPVIAFAWFYMRRTTDRNEVAELQRKREAAASPFPFECENCGHKPTPHEVLYHHGDCAKCGDTVIAYTVDAAECIVRLIAIANNQQERNHT